MDEKCVKVDDIVEYCNTYSAYLQNKGQGVAQAALRRVTEFAKENSADVQPVVHAKWEISSDGYYPYCSRCFGRPNGELTKYCPDCGARMDLDSVTREYKAENIAQKKTIAEYKRLLKLAVEDNKCVLRENFGDICQFCKHYSNSEALCRKPHNGSGSWCCENAEWRYANESLALIGETNDEP